MKNLTMKITWGVKFHPKRFLMVKSLIRSDAMSRQGAMVRFANIDSSMEKKLLVYCLVLLRTSNNKKVDCLSVAASSGQSTVHCTDKDGSPVPKKPEADMALLPKSPTTIGLNWGC